MIISEGSPLEYTISVFMMAGTRRTTEGLIASFVVLGHYRVTAYSLMEAQNRVYIRFKYLYEYPDSLIEKLNFGWSVNPEPLLRGGSYFSEN